MRWCPVANEDDKLAGKPNEPARSLDLPFATAEEHAKFFDIIRQLEAGTLSADMARTRVLQLYDTGLGAWVRALGRSHPEIAARVAKGLLRDLEQVTQNLASDAESADSPRQKPAKAHRPKLTSKIVEVLERERLVVETLLKANEPQTLADLRKIVARLEPGIEAAALTANLDRLEKDAVIDRPRKGYYAANDGSTTYLQALTAEIEARGSRKR